MLLKETLWICLGSACHQMGGAEVLSQTQRLIKENQLEDKIELKGAFCLGQCCNGIVMKYQDHVFSKIDAKNVSEKFVQEILPCLSMSGKEMPHG